MNNSGIILTLAYPETIVRVSEEKWLSHLHYLGIGKKNYVRAGHAALVLIEKSTGNLEYFDFGRYTTPLGFGRVRSKDTDCELNFPLRASIKNDDVENLNEIIEFLATNPKLTHGEGKMFVSVCSEVDHNKAKAYITSLKQKGLIRYAVFQKNASNCSRFVTDALIASVNNKSIRKKLIRSNLFTPSTIGNVVNAAKVKVFEVSANGEINVFSASAKKMNLKYFLDRLNGFKPNLIGNIEPKPVKGLSSNAQWLEGIGAGAWFELYETSINNEFRFKRISPYGHIDVDDVYVLNCYEFKFNLPYKFVHYSNCKFFHIKQNGAKFKFNRKLS